MKIVVDTNVVFSAILNTNSRIATILLSSKTKFNFYSSNQLLLEIDEHADKLKKLSGYSDDQLKRITGLFTRRIRFIDVRIIPKKFYEEALLHTQDVDIDDTEFIALTNYINGKFWSGDQSLKKGLLKKGWDEFVTTEELFQFLIDKY